MRRILIAAFAAPLLLAGVAHAQDVLPGEDQVNQKVAPSGHADTLSSSDQQFMMRAAASGLMEVKLGKLAIERASSPEVKDMAKRIIEDHTKANDELKQLATQKGVMLPTTLDREQMQTYEKLSALQGAEFDKEYVNIVKKGHDKTLADFKRESTTAQDPDLKAFVQKTLPTIQMHDNMVHQNAQKM